MPQFTDEQIEAVRALVSAGRILDAASVISRAAGRGPLRNVHGMIGLLIGRNRDDGFPPAPWDTQRKLVEALTRSSRSTAA